MSFVGCGWRCPPTDFHSKFRETSRHDHLVRLPRLIAVPLHTVLEVAVQSKLLRRICHQICKTNAAKHQAVQPHPTRQGAQHIAGNLTSSAQHPHPALAYHPCRTSRRLRLVSAPSLRSPPWCSGRGRPWSAETCCPGVFSPLDDQAEGGCCCVRGGRERKQWRGRSGGREPPEGDLDITLLASPDRKLRFHFFALYVNSCATG